MRWVSLEGKPSLEKMTSEDACLTHVHGIVVGETPNTCEICLFTIRTPFDLVSFTPKLDSGKKFLDSYEPAKDVLEWLEHGVDVKKFIKPFKGSFMGVKYHKSRGYASMPGF